MQTETEAPEAGTVDIEVHDQEEGQDQQTQIDGETGDHGVETQAEETQAAAPVVQAPDPAQEELKQAAGWAQQTWQRLQKSPKLEQAYLETLREEGQLPPAGVERLRQLQQAQTQAQTQAAPKMTEDQLNQKIGELQALGKFTEAQRLYQEHFVDPKIQASQQEFRQAQEAMTRADADKQAQARQAQVKAELIEAQSTYKDLIELDPRDGMTVKYKDPALQKEVQRIVSGNLTAKEYVELALLRMGKATKAKTTQAVQEKPAVRTVATPAAGKNTAKPGEVSIYVRQRK